MSVEAGKGLAGVVVADTRKSKVDGENGRLHYVGYKIFDLATNATFEEVTFLLLNNRLPKQKELDEFTKEIIKEMPVEDVYLSVMRSFPKSAHPMAVLRTMISMLGVYDPEAEDNSLEATLRKGLRILAKAPTLTAAWARIRDGKDPVAPHRDLGIAANFIYMLNDKEPIESQVAAMDTYLILLADHDLNASTFTSRVVTSTDGDIHSAITAAIGALKGPKHGGANEAAMKMFMEIGSVDAVDEFFTKQVKGEGRKIMGIGHRVYKALDPRATVLKERAEALAKGTGNSKWYDIASRLESLARDDGYFIERQLYANVDYYSAIVLYTLGIDPDMMTPLFVISRISGWAAHILEQWADNRLIRPLANYVGTLDEPWIPIEKR